MDSGFAGECPRPGMTAEEYAGRHKYLLIEFYYCYNLRIIPIR